MFLARLLFRLEPLWSDSREVPPTAQPDVPADLGAWRTAFGPDGEHDDALAYARAAVLGGASTVTAVLTVTTPSGEKLRLRSVSGVVAHSSRDTAARLAAKANALPSLFLSKARGRTPDEFFALLRRRIAIAKADAPPKPPGAPDARAHLRRLLRALREDLFTRKQWRLLFGDNLDRAPEPGRLARMTPPRDRIWADPFLFEAEGKAWVFFEEMLFRERRGRIAVGVWDGQKLRDTRPALERAHHLSFPQIFVFEGRPHLIAEAAGSGALTAYECVRWPDTWGEGRKIFEGPAIDPSVFEHAGRWWLFVNLAAAPGAKADDDLHLFYSDNPLSGRWTPHALNPVVCDARFARGAGRPYVHNGKLHRPAQDCAGGYGRKVVLREITALSPSDYAEHTAGTLSTAELGPDAVALHTLNPGRKYVACDYAVRR